jgi:predicted membrane chloride channel (bestrophin family)
MKNLEALVYGRQQNNHQKYLAAQEFEKLIKSNKEANEFIIDIANLLNMDTDSVGLDDIKFSIDDFKDAIHSMKVNSMNAEKSIQ